MDKNISLFGTLKNNLFETYLWEHVTKQQFRLAINFIFEVIERGITIVEIMVLEKGSWAYNWDDPLEILDHHDELYSKYQILTTKSVGCAIHFLINYDIVEDYEIDGIVYIEMVKK